LPVLALEVIELLETCRVDLTDHITLVLVTLDALASHRDLLQHFYLHFGVEQLEVGLLVFSCTARAHCREFVAQLQKHYQQNQEHVRHAHKGNVFIR